MKFPRDRFSESNPKWISMTAGEKNKIKSLIAILEERHSSSIGRVVNIRRLDGLEINSSNLLIDGSTGSVVVKLIDFKDTYSLHFQEYVYRHIKSLQLPGPYILSNNNSDLLGQPFIVMEYIPGDYFSGSNLDLSLVSHAIRKFHNGLSNLDALSFDEIPVLQSNSHHILTEFLITKDGWDLKFGADLALFLRQNIDLIIDTEAKCSANVSTLLKLEKSILHIDLHPHNIIIGSNKVTIVDIDSIKSVAWPSAIGFCFYKLARQVIAERGANQNNFSELKDFFEIIVSDYGVSESRVSLCFLGGLTEVLRRTLTVIEGNLNNKVSPWNKVLEIQIRSISEIYFLYRKVFGNPIKLDFYKNI